MKKKVRIILFDGSRAWGYATDEHPRSSVGFPVITIGDRVYDPTRIAQECMRIICTDADIRKCLAASGYSPEATDTPKGTIGIYISSTLLERIDSKARQEKQSRNTFITKALEKALDDHTDED